MTWVYVRSEPGLWTTGFYDPEGKWHADEDFDSSEQAAKRVHYLNGGKPAMDFVGDSKSWQAMHNDL